MGGIVYILCMLLSLACALLLFKGYKQNQFRLLFWSSLGFFGFALNNLLLFVDLIVFQESYDLSVIRTIPALMGMVTLVYGLITDAV